MAGRGGLRGFAIDPESGEGAQAAVLDPGSHLSEADAGHEQDSFLPDRALDASLHPVPVAPSAPASPQAPAQAATPGEIELPDQLPRLEGVYNQVAKTDPDHAARVLALSQRLQQPEAFIDKNLPAAEKAAQALPTSFFAQLEAQYPGTAEWLSTPAHMALSHDDLHSVASHEQVIRGGEVAMGILDAAQAGWQASAPGLALRGRLPDLNLPENAGMLERLVKGGTEMVADLPAMIVGSAVGAGVGATVGGAAGTATLPVVGTVGGVVGGATVGGLMGGFAAPALYKKYMMEELGQGSLIAADNPISRISGLLREATKHGAIGLAAGAGGLIPSKLAGGLVSRGLLDEGGRTAVVLSGGTAHLGGELAGMTAATSAEEGKLPSATDVLENAILMAGMHGAGALTNTGLQSLYEARRAQMARNFYLALGDTAQGAKLRERMPEAQQNLIASLTKNGPVENIFISAQRAVEYFQSKKIDPTEAMAELGVAKSFQEARATGGDIKIPLADWATKLSGEHFRALADDVKFDPDSLSFRETEAAHANAQARMKEIADRQAEQEKQAQATQSLEDQQKQTLGIADQVREQLQAAGLTPEEAQFNPEIHEALFRTLGQAMGVDPAELAQRYPLTIERMNAQQAADVNRQKFDPDALTRIRSEVEAGSVEQGGLKRDDEGYVTGRVGRSSSFPDYMKEKGYTKKSVLSALDKLEQGKRLTDKQHAMVADLYNTSGHAKEAAPVAEANEPFLQSAKPSEPLPEVQIDTHPDGTRVAKRREGQSKRAFRQEAAAHFPEVDTPLLEGESLEQVRAAALEKLRDWNRMPAASPAFGGQIVLVDESSINHILSGKRNEADQLNRLRRFGRALTILEHAPFANEVREEPNGTKFYELTGAFPDGEIDQAVVIDRNGKKLLSVFQKDKVATSSRRVAGSSSNIPDSDPSSTSGNSQLNQADASVARGRIRIGGEGSDRTFHIDILEGADRSTFLHETGHYFLEILKDVASKDDAPEHIKQDYQTLRDWMGLKEGEEIATDHHEQFARGFEKYLAEGNAPSAALARAFDRFSRWLTSIYRDLRGLNVELTDEVRGVMDRLLATQEEVARAEQATGQPRDLRAELPPDVPQPVTERIARLQEEARATAERELMRGQMKELTEAHREFLKEARERATERAEAEVKELPIARAMDELRAATGKRDLLKEATKVTERLSHGPGTAPAEWEVAAERHGYGSGQELAHAIREAIETKTLERETKLRVEAEMQQHADLKDSGKIREEALKVIHNDRSAELLALEGEILRDRVRAEMDRTEAGHARREARDAQAQADQAVQREASQRNRMTAKIEADAAKEMARVILEGRTIRDAGNARTYITQERNAAVRAAKAMARGDEAGAATAKREQLLNHALATQAMRNKAAAEKAVTFLEKFAHRGADMMEMPYGFIRQIDQMLTRVGMAADRGEDTATLQKIAQGLEGEGATADEIANQTGYVRTDTGWVQEQLPDLVERINDNYYVVDLPDAVMNGATRDFADLTFQELGQLRDSVATLADIGKRYDDFLSFDGKVKMKEVAKEFRASLEKNFGTPRASELLPGSPHDGKLGDALSMLSRLPGAFDGQLDTILTTMHKFDGLQEGPAKKYLYRPFAEAEARKLARMKGAMTELDSLFGKHYEPKEFAAYRETRLNIDGRYFTKEEILSMALNWGNEGNRARLMRGFGFDEAKMSRIFDHLGKKDWDFAQDVWKSLDKYWPDIVKLEMDANGVQPKGVDPAPFTNRHGKYEGGYYPIAYDFERSTDAFKNNLDKSALYKTFSTAAAYTDQGHTKARVTNVTRPLRLSLDVLRNHHEDVIHDLEFRRAVIDANRFLKQPDVKTAITGAVGVRGYQGIQDWLKSVAGGNSEPIGYLDNVARRIRFATTFFNMSYRFITAPKIAAENVVNVSSELGLSGTARAIKDYYVDDRGMHDTIVEKSQFMRMRSEHLDRDLSDIIRRQQGQGASSFSRHAFFIHAYLDQGMSFPLWADTYKRALADHGDERLAVNQADEAVKRTFMTGGRIDQPAVMRGSEKMKALTVAYGYSSMMWQRFSQARFDVNHQWIQGNKVAAAATAARAFVYQFAMPALIATATREFLRNNQTSNAEDEKKRMIAGALEELTPLKFIPILRDIAPVAIEKAMGERATFHSVPLYQAAEALIDPIASSVHSFASGREDPKLLEKSAKAISLMTGVPKTINDVAFNFIDWQQGHGEATWRDFLSRRTKK